MISKLISSELLQLDKNKGSLKKMEPEQELDMKQQGKQSIGQNYPIIIRINRKSLLKRKSQRQKHMLFDFVGF